MAKLDVKKEILRLLKEDEEFRYTVMGYLGLSEILKRMDRHEEELVKLREDMNKLREDMNKLREDMNRGFMLIERRISALGARWGLMSEEAFREGLRGILGKELGLTVERWTHYDSRGVVYGRPAQVDVAVSDDKVLLIEVSSHVRRSDVAAFHRKARLYQEVTGRRPHKLIMVTPFIDDDAFRLALDMGVEVYTRI